MQSNWTRSLVADKLIRLVDTKRWKDLKCGRFPPFSMPIFPELKLQRPSINRRIRNGNSHILNGGMEWIPPFSILPLLPPFSMSISRSCQSIARNSDVLNGGIHSIPPFSILSLFRRLVCPLSGQSIRV
jgi:hypothetical protein